MSECAWKKKNVRVLESNSVNVQKVFSRDHTAMVRGTSECNIMSADPGRKKE